MTWYYWIPILFFGYVALESVSKHRYTIRKKNFNDKNIKSNKIFEIMGLSHTGIIDVLIKYRLTTLSDLTEDQKNTAGHYVINIIRDNERMYDRFIKLVSPHINLDAAIYDSMYKIDTVNKNELKNLFLEIDKIMFDFVKSGRY